MIMLNIRGNLFLTLFVFLASTLNSAVAHALPVSAPSIAKNSLDAVFERDICTNINNARSGLTQLIETLGETVKDVSKDPVIFKIVAQFDAQIAAILCASGCTNKIKRVDSSRHNKEDLTERDGMGDVLNSLTNTLNVLGRSLEETGENGGMNNTPDNVFVIDIVNFLDMRPDWTETAVIIAFDDADGWYLPQSLGLGTAPLGQ
ncbi:hypothetical protein SISSUDRAFT_308393 [Sistotremastrum suecicum HHB10207 ss-3]|uniref:Uncharacterized protein n=1 Tax=Sistotremastrum suecicum HHB10207 ss-3 TaxID=1314776 RepID=A0A165ZE92_9AGAM|nr:hypothetical protein SISSUDRAFT_308393 [Sistotremastrum suecicum HHB10207 ss-3]